MVAIKAITERSAIRPDEQLAFAREMHILTQVGPVAPTSPTGLEGPGLLVLRPVERGVRPASVVYRFRRFRLIPFGLLAHILRRWLDPPGTHPWHLLSRWARSPRGSETVWNREARRGSRARKRQGGNSIAVFRGGMKSIQSTVETILAGQQYTWAPS